MGDRGLQAVLQHARQLITAEMVAGLSDHELLQRFVQRRDEAAFTALVQRHAPMVLGVCRRVLKHGHDAEDASQATFLVLARTASSIRKHAALGSWLYGVAYRISRKIQTGEARRRAREARAGRTTISGPNRDASWREVQAALDEELMSLPEKYRAPLVLCYLEERTRDEAAAQLGLLLSTLRGRLEQGRDLLRSRLARRGVTLSAALLVPALAEAAGSGFVSPTLIVATVQAALGRSAGMEAARVALLAEGAVKAMTTSKMKLAIALFLLLGLVAGSGVIAHQISTATDPEIPPEAAQEPAKKGPDEAKKTESAEGRLDLYGDPLPPDAIARLGTVRFRAGGLLTSIAYTPDGKQIVSHGPWSGVNVWDAASGKELRRVTAAADDWLGAALLTPDTQSVVTLDGAGQKHFIRIRDRAELKVMREFPVGYMHSPRLTPDGKLVIALAGNGNEISVEVWDLKEGKQVRSWKAHEGHAWCIDLSRDGKTLATGGADKTIRVWDVTTGRLTRELIGNPNVVGRVAVSPDGKVVASLGMTEVKLGNASVFPWDNRIRIWDVDTGKEMRQVKMEAKGDNHGHPPGFSMLVFSPDGKTLITAGADGLLRLWDPITGKEQRQFEIGRAGVMSIAFAPDGQTLAVGSSAIRLLDLVTGKEKLPQFGHLWSVFSVATTPDGRTAATGADGSIQLWDAQTGKPRKRLDGHEKAVTALRISGDGRTLVSLSFDKTLRLWDLDSGKERWRLDAPNPGFAALAITHDATTVAQVNDDKSIRLVDTATGQERTRFPPSDEPVTGAAFTPDGRTLIVWHVDHKASVWDVAAGKKVRQFEFAESGNPVPRPIPVGARGRRIGSSYVAAVSPDGRLIAYGSQDNFLAVHEVATGKPVRLIENLQPDGAGTLAFSPDGRSLAWSGWRQPAIHLLELATGKERMGFNGHNGRVASLAFSGDGRILVSGSEDTTGLVWDLNSYRADKAGFLDLDAAWRDLASDDAAVAFKAMRRLASSPKDAIALLQKRVLPIPIPDEKRLTKLIADLDSNQFDMREAARQELEKLGETALPACRAALKGNPALELRRRLEGLDEKQVREIWNPGPERLRALRAVEVLEMADTPESRAALKTLAAGAPGAQLTEEAKSSQVRLANRPVTE